jgi:nitroreductase
MRRTVIINAKTDHPINELIAKRWSARAFSTRPVERAKLLSILEAARWAPSSRNEQPWCYIIFTNDNTERLKKAQSVLKDINTYAKRAPVLICAITKRKHIQTMEIIIDFIFMIWEQQMKICFLKPLIKG